MYYRRFRRTTRTLIVCIRYTVVELVEFVFMMNDLLHWILDWIGLREL